MDLIGSGEKNERFRETGEKVEKANVWQGGHWHDVFSFLLKKNVCLLICLLAF